MPGDTSGAGQEDHETVNRESHANAAGPEGLAGDMGLSSERAGPFEGIEGTGSLASAQAATDGEAPPVQAPEGDHEENTRSSEDPDKPDQTSPATGVDRTVGEVRPDPVVHKHEFDPSRNPRH